MDHLIPILEQTLAADQQLLDASLRCLAAWADAAFPWLATALANLAAGGLTATGTASQSVRRQAAIQLKNLVRGNGGARWQQLDPGQRQQIRAALMAGLLGGGGGRSCGLSQCVQAVAELELPAGAWPDLLEQLVARVIGAATGGGSRDDGVVADCLETVGYICESVAASSIDEGQVDQLLTAVVYAMKAADLAAEVKVAAVTALTNALELATRNFARLAERNYIMEVKR